MSRRSSRKSFTRRTSSGVAMSFFFKSTWFSSLRGTMSTVTSPSRRGVFRHFARATFPTT